MNKYEEGSRVIITISNSNNELAETKGVILYYDPSRVRYSYVIGKDDKVTTNYLDPNFLGTFAEDQLRLDVQYYREERLKQILE